MHSAASSPRVTGTVCYFVANAEYIAKTTGTVGTFLIDTGGSHQKSTKGAPSVRIGCGRGVQSRGLVATEVAVAAMVVTVPVGRLLCDERASVGDPEWTRGP